MNKLAQVNIGSTYGSVWGVDFGFADLVSVILRNSFVIAGILLLFLMIFGGISIMFGAGSGNPESAGRGKKAITSAVIGFAIIFAAYWIVQIIEIITGMPNLLNPGF